MLLVQVNLDYRANGSGAEERRAAYARAVTYVTAKEAGFDFLMDWPCDDQPIWLKTRQGRIMAVPYGLDLNDVTQMMFHHHTAQAYGDMLIDRFEEIRLQVQSQVDQGKSLFHPEAALPEIRKAFVRFVCFC